MLVLTHQEQVGSFCSLPGAHLCIPLRTTVLPIGEIGQSTARARKRRRTTGVIETSLHHCVRLEVRALQAPLADSLPFALLSRENQGSNDWREESRNRAL